MMARRRGWAPATICISRRTAVIGLPGPIRRRRRYGLPCTADDAAGKVEAQDEKAPATGRGSRHTCSFRLLAGLHLRLQITLLDRRLRLLRAGGGRRLDRRVHRGFVRAEVLEHDGTVLGVGLGQAVAGLVGRRRCGRVARRGRRVADAADDDRSAPDPVVAMMMVPPPPAPMDVMRMDLLEADAAKREVAAECEVG